MGIHQDRPLQSLPLAAVQIRQGGETPAVVLNSGILPEQFRSRLAAITVGQLHRTAQVSIAEAAGAEWIDHRLRCHRQPFTTAIGMEARHLQLTGLKQP